MPPSDAAVLSHPNPAFSVRRVGAMVLRYWYLLRGSWPRFLELAYWPTMQMILWGYINQFMATSSAWVAQGAGVLVSAVLLWDVLFRGQLGVSVSFLEEMWSRNLGHLFVSPLRPGEWLAALMVMSLIRTLIGIVPAALLARYGRTSLEDVFLDIARDRANGDDSSRDSSREAADAAE